ncbi:hypothetical protein [Microbulbifer mangrovi]|uniref:hypothetical protein n=1 Tax=Microbulbifer mangrovi TaxID=927787 RepID=UPI000990497D|nr:hypothetical protein [Microbulbifer mangrovi]
MNKCFAAVAAFALSATALTASATPVQGDVDDAASQGSFDIILNVNSAIVVKMLDDMTLTVDGATPDAPIVGRENICVGGIGHTQYTVNLSSTNGGLDTGVFQLLGNGTTPDTMNYNVAFANNVIDTATGDTIVASSGDIDASPYALADNLSCASGENAQVIVSVPAAEWQAAVDAVYGDTLTVTVAGE